MQHLQGANLIILTCLGFCLADLEVAYQWKYVDYTWKSVSRREKAIQTGKYDHKNIIPYDVQPLADGRVLVTTPRHSDNPASVSTISGKTCAGGPMLSPYPDWSWHTKKDCSGITSVNRVIVDEYNRLWLVDSGKIGNRQVCPAKILAFDITTDELIKEIKIPKELSHNPEDEGKGELEISAVETSGDDKEKVWVYIGDLLGYGLLIWNGNEIWRLNHEAFLPESDATQFSIAGVNFTLNVGPTVSAITPEGFLRKPALIFKPLTGLSSHAVSLEDLHNSNCGPRPTYYHANLTQPSQEISRDFSKRGGVLVVTFSTETAIACWNLQYPLEASTAAILATDETTLQYVNAIKITLNADEVGQTFWALSNRYQNYITGVMDFDEINFRVLKDDFDSMIKGTVCEPSSYEIADGIGDKAFSVDEP